MFKEKKVVIFDMDGTLIDSIGMWNEVDAKLIKKLGCNDSIKSDIIQRERDEVLKKYSKCENVYIKYCEFLGEKYKLALSGKEIFKIRYEIVKDYLDNIDYKPNADVLIKKLREKGFIMGIASTTGKNAMNIYRTTNKNLTKKASLDKYFSFIYTREDVKEIKPKPDIYYRILKELNVLPEECLIIEDSLVGVEAANNANIEVAVVYDKYSDENREKINMLANYKFNNFNEIIEKLNEEIEQ